MKLNSRLSRMLLLLALAFVGATVSASAQGTAFTYQGRLNVNTNPATGIYDFQFSLYDASGGGTLVAAPLLVRAVGVTNGLFTVILNFGAGVFTGADRWLSIEVGTAGSGSFNLLDPRQPLTPAPYAIHSAQTGDIQSGANPTFTGTATFNPPSGPPFAVGNANKVPNLNADLLDGFDSSAFVLKAGDTMTGNLTIANPATLSFGSSVRQMLNLFDVQYALGVQANTLYQRTHNHFAWFKDGIHSDLERVPGAGGKTLMELLNPGNLTVYGESGIAVHGQSSGSGGFDVGVFGNALASSGETYGVLGRSISSSGYGVRGENSGSSGIGVSGLHGGGTGSTTPAGVYGESTAASGNGVVGVANNGGNAYGVWGKSTSGLGGRFDGATYGVYASSASGLAGYFSGPAKVEMDSTLSRPHVELHETQEGDFARLRLQSAARPYWDIAVGGGAANQMNFYNSTNGDVMSLKQDGTLLVKVLTITGGADIAEPFNLSGDKLPEGSVVVIDENKPGHLKLSTHAYDTRVAGVISGAGGVNPGLSLSQRGGMEGSQQVALTGRVYVQSDASLGAIKPGDLLTTSATPGHAMRAADSTRMHGAILGKAMTELKADKGLVLVLVTLQ